MKKGRIQVTVQREDRLRAINNLSEAIKEVAKALNQAPRVLVTHCVVTNKAKSSVGIGIDTAEEVDRTEVKEIDDEE